MSAYRVETNSNPAGRPSHSGETSSRMSDFATSHSKMRVPRMAVPASWAVRIQPGGGQVTRRCEKLAGGRLSVH